MSGFHFIFSEPLGEEHHDVDDVLEELQRGTEWHSDKKTKQSSNVSNQPIPLSEKKILKSLNPVTAVL